MTTNRAGDRVRLCPTSVIPGVVFLAVCVAFTGCATTGGEVSQVAAPEEPTLDERWGVEVVALRLTGGDYMLDFRYKVLDPEKAGELFERANKPVLIHNSTGARLEVPRPAKTGPLRPTNPPQAGRTYFMLFSNPGVVHAGDEVTIEIGDFETSVIVE